MNTPRSLSNSRHGPACAAFEPLLPLAAHDLLEPEEGRTLQGHLADCAHCRARLAAYDRLDAALRRRFEQGVPTALLTEDMMQKIEHREDREREAPIPQPPQRAAARPHRVLSWVSAIAAVLVIALVVTALVASHGSSTGTKNTNNEPGVSSGPGLYYSATTLSSPQQSLIYALNPTTGSVRWQVKMPVSLSVSPELVDHGVLYVVANDYSKVDPGKDGTPATHGNAPDQSTLYALRASDGKQLWRTPTNSTIYAPVVVVNGLVYVGTEAGVLFALNANDGSVKWHRSFGAVPDVKQVVDDVIYVGVSKSNDTDTLLALNASDGSTKWSFPLQGSYVDVNVLNDVIAVVDSKTGTGKDNLPDTSRFISVLNTSDGSVKWQYQGDPAKVDYALAGQNTFYVALLGGTGKEQPDVTLQALNLSDGSLRWQKSYASFHLLSELGNGKAYVTVNNDTIVALNAQDGSTAWQAEVGNALFINGVLGGTLYAQADTNLYALNADSGAVLWRYQLGEGEWITGANSQIAYGLVKPTTPQEKWYLRLLAIDNATGKELWQKDLTVSLNTVVVG